ncbi:MAG: ornithine cyclodeaminase family protein [Myxococcales bacterium]
MALVLTRGDVASLLTLDDCIAAIEDAFRRVGTGEARPAGILGFPVAGGGFHVKAAALGDRFAAKVNGNFSGNPALGLPAILGAILLSDSGNGRLLAVLDSIEITILRTGAATAVAAKHLARPTSRIATICGCGNQGRVQLRALARVLVEHRFPRRRACQLRQAFVYDIEPRRAAALGELHHAIEAGSMRREDVHAELGEIVSGRKRGRTDDEEITVFDSTGTALQDGAAAASVYAAATRLRKGIEIDL